MAPNWLLIAKELGIWTYSGLYWGIVEYSGMWEIYLFFHFTGSSLRFTQRWLIFTNRYFGFEHGYLALGFSKHGGFVEQLMVSLSGTWSCQLWHFLTSFLPNTKQKLGKELRSKGKGDATCDSRKWNMSSPIRILHWTFEKGGEGDVTEFHKGVTCGSSQRYL